MKTPRAHSRVARAHMCTGRWLHYSSSQIRNSSSLAHNKQRQIHQKSPMCGKYEKFNRSTEEEWIHREMYKINILCYLLYLFFITNLFRNRHKKLIRARKKKIGGRRNDRYKGGGGRGLGRGCEGPQNSKAGSFMFKGTFLFP